MSSPISISAVQLLVLPFAVEDMPRTTTVSASSAAGENMPRKKLRFIPVLLEQGWPQLPDQTKMTTTPCVPASSLCTGIHLYPAGTYPKNNRAVYGTVDTRV